MTRNIQATDAQGNKVSEPVQINGVDPTSSGGGGAFEDGDGDGIYTLPNAGDGIDVASVDTDNLTLAGRIIDSIIEGETTGLRVEHGDSSFSSLAGASDATWDTNTGNKISVSFATAFSSTPSIITGGIGATNGRVIAFNRSTTAFDHQMLNYATTSMSGTASWLSIGPE